MLLRIEPKLSPSAVQPAITPPNPHPNTLVFDLGRFGIQVVASPRHADGLLITGAVKART